MPAITPVDPSVLPVLEESEGQDTRIVELYQRHGPVIRAWTEAEIGGSEFGRLATDGTPVSWIVSVKFHCRLTSTATARCPRTRSVTRPSSRNPPAPSPKSGKLF